jgi:hypothetical protein
MFPKISNGFEKMARPHDWWSARTVKLFSFLAAADLWGVQIYIEFGAFSLGS